MILTLKLKLYTKIFSICNFRWKETQEHSRTVLSIAAARWHDSPMAGENRSANTLRVSDWFTVGGIKFESTTEAESS